MFLPSLKYSDIYSSDISLLLVTFALFVYFLHFSQPGQGKQAALLLVCISFTVRFVYVLAQ